MFHNSFPSDSKNKQLMKENTEQETTLGIKSYIITLIEPWDTHRPIRYNTIPKELNTERFLLLNMTEQSVADQHSLLNRKPALNREKVLKISETFWGS